MNLRELNTRRIQDKKRKKVQYINNQKLQAPLQTLQPKILQPLTNKNLRTIVQVYQYNYVNEKSPGFGDFLRGSFYLMQVARILNVDFKIDISNHPISEFIVNHDKSNDIQYNNISFLLGINRLASTSLSSNPPNNMYMDIDFVNSIISKINQSNAETFALFSNAFPIFYDFSEYGRNFIKSFLKPNNIMVDYIKCAFNKLCLQPNTYAVIHIRTGDEFLSSQRASLPSFANKIIQFINNLRQPDKKYLIISDNNALKSRLKAYSNFYVDIHYMEHLGGECNYNKRTDGIKNTLLDFYLMSYSNSILSLSVYGHGSGFSKYCSEIYNIPFKNITINKDHFLVKML
jgi:hypothetical protein